MISRGIVNHLLQRVPVDLGGAAPVGVDDFAVLELPAYREGELGFVGRGRRHVGQGFAGSFVDEGAGLLGREHHGGLASKGLFHLDRLDLPAQKRARLGAGLVVARHHDHGDIVSAGKWWPVARSPRPSGRRSSSGPKPPSFGCGTARRWAWWAHRVVADKEGGIEPLLEDRIPFARDAHDRFGPLVEFFEQKALCAVVSIPYHDAGGAGLEGAGDGGVDFAHEEPAGLQVGARIVVPGLVPSEDPTDSFEIGADEDAHGWFLLFGLGEDTPQ